MKSAFENQSDSRRSVPPDPTSTSYYVSGRRGRGYWIAHDNASGYACRVDVNFTDVALANQQLLMAVTQYNATIEPGRAILLHMETPTACTCGPEGWVEAYQLVPGLGAMLNGDDISDDEFTWLPPWDWF